MTKEKKSEENHFENRKVTILNYKKITQVVDKRVEIKIEKLTFFTAKRSSLNYS